MAGFAESHPADYSVDAVLAGARDLTGLVEPGPDNAWAARLQVWIDVAHDLRGHFGIQPGQVRKPFEDYMARHDVPIEVRR